MCSSCSPSSSPVSPDFIDRLNAVIWEADPTTFQFSYVSRGIETLLGYSLEHWLTRPNFWVDVVHPDDRDQAVRVCRKAVDACEDHDVEYRVVTASGEVRWIRDLISVTCDPAGRPSQLRGLMVDVSESKRAAVGIRHQFTQLVAGVAHDLNNLLHVVQGRLDLALEAGLTDQARSDLLEGQQAVDLATTLVAQLRNGLDDKGAQPSLVDVNGRIARMQGTLQTLLGESIQLDLRLAAVESRVAIPRGSIERVVMNLVVNAKEAMPRGGSLRILTSTMPACTAPSLLLEISDTGTGMPTHICDQIFKPFFTTKQSTDCCGLGLAIVARIVRDAHGEIGVRSIPGEGTSLRVVLPLATDSANA
jgi:PAS domain S-box-containing protein